MDCIVKLGRYIRNQYDVKTVGITGSCGKTTTKTLISLVLSKKFNIHTNIANANDVDNVFDFITKLGEEHEFYVQEVSGAGPGRVNASSIMLNLDASVITNIGNYHLDLYRTVENVAYDKLKIIENFSQNGIAFLNLEDTILSDINSNIKGNRKLVYVSEVNKNADYYIEKVTQYSDGLEVCILDNYTQNKGKEYIAKVDIIGKHNAFDIVAAFAVGQ